MLKFRFLLQLTGCGMTDNRPVAARGTVLLCLLAILVAAHPLSCCPEVKLLDGTVSSTVDGGALQVRYKVIQQELFDRHCVTDCHESINAAANLRLTQDRSYLDLVNQASQQITSRIRVKPGQPDDSYLVRKLEGGPGIVGDRMPRLAPPRPQVEIDRVRVWIDRGASND
jgi:hypothetical protein